MDYILIELNEVYILVPTSHYLRFVLLLSFYVDL